jgi:hypothetical protein
LLVKCGALTRLYKYYPLTLQDLAYSSVISHVSFSLFFWLVSPLAILFSLLFGYLVSGRGITKEKKILVTLWFMVMFPGSWSVNFCSIPLKLKHVRKRRRQKCHSLYGSGHFHKAIFLLCSETGKRFLNYSKLFFYPLFLYSPLVFSFLS